MATFFRNSVIKDVGIVPVRVLETTPTTRATVIGLSMANLSESVITVNVMVQDNTSVTGYYLKDIIIPPQSTLKAVNGGEKLILAPSNQLYVSSNIGDSVDVICTYVEIV
jgi:hypothetical protein